MHFDPSPLSYVFVAPFVGMLLSIALGPLLFSHLWERFALHISLGWAMTTFVLLLGMFGVSETSQHLGHTLSHEYFPFILMIGALFTVTGGIHIVIRGVPGPFQNTGFLLVGSIMASLIGTTGAAMLLIRPFIELNKRRHYKAHLIVFFIFTVANIGGSLTPLGDPPLFLGYLKGIPFEWPLIHLIKPLCLTLFPLLLLFLGLDLYFYRKDLSHPSYQEGVPHQKGEGRMSITGKINLLFLACIVAVVWSSGMAMAHKPAPILLGLTSVELARDMGLLVIMGLSLIFTPGTVRHYNHFSWGPYREVAEVFFGIFITLIPVVAMLHQGLSGPFGSLIHLANPNGVPCNALYFWLTGGLSAFLDNAPTYLVFYNMAEGVMGAVANGGENLFLTGGLTQTLVAISTGAVFMGAFTYIGNAPNFMVRSIAESKHIKMPSFFGYILWSIVCLFPVFFCLSYMMF